MDGIMFTVALIGPDGAGKTTIGRQVERTLPLPVKYLYMGVNADSSNHLLPTTRALRALKRLCGIPPDPPGPPDPKRPARPTPRGRARRVLSRLKTTLTFTNHVCEEWFRQGLAWYYSHRGQIVLFDRHFFSDFYANDIAATNQRRPLRRRIHGWMLRYLYPRPDLIIYLEAPAAVMLARKGEGTLESIERLHQQYLLMRGQVKHFVTVDASQPVDAVARDVTAQICDFYRTRTGHNGKPRYEFP